MIQDVMKKILNELMLEQQELAKMLGVEKTTINSYVHGRRTPRVPLIRKIMKLAKDNNIDIKYEDFFN